MDDDRYIFSRPVAVTEDRIKTALEKQAKQKALKAALDRQVREAERLKAEAHRAKGRQNKRLGDPKANGPPASPSVYSESKVRTTSSAATNSVAGPSPTVGTATAPGMVESTRYTFSFRKGQGTFEVEDSSARHLQVTLPPSAGGCERGGGAAPRATTGEAGNAPARVRQQAASREVNSGTGRRNSHGGRSATAANSSEYQTNSLPVNFSVGKETAGRKPPSPECSGSGRDASGHSRSKGGSGYDTQSLPVELIYKLGQANSNGNIGKPRPRRVTTPLGPPSSGRASESRGLQSPMGPLTGTVSGSPMAAARDNFASPSTDSMRNSDWIGVGGGRALLSPHGGSKGASRVLGSGGGTPQEKALAARYASPRPSARLAGGILPPLNTRNDSDVIEMSAVLDTTPPPREYRAAGAAIGAPGARTPASITQPLSRRQTSRTPAEQPPRPSPPPSPLDTAAAEQALKQAEREKAWAQQVKQIKAELRKTRTKGLGKGGFKAEGRGATGDAPRRAETAPDPLPHPPMRGVLGVGGSGGSGAGGAHGRYGGGGARGNAGGSRPPQVERMDFAKAHIFTRENFRPITAPEDATSYFGMLSPPSLPPLVQASKTKQLEQTQACSEPVTDPEGEDMAGTEAASSSNTNAINTFASTGTSGEESLKLASLTTRQVTLGLPDYGNSDPVPIQFNHLLQFVEAQMITASQAENLWDFFAMIPDVAGGGGSESDAGRAGSSLSITSTRDVWGRAARGDANGATGGRESSVVKVVEGRASLNGVAPGGVEGDVKETDDERTFYIPHSSSQLPTSAILAPALRRKISQQHSEREAAVLHQPHQPLHNGHRRLIPAGASGGGEAETDSGAGGGLRTSPSNPRGLKKKFSTTAETGCEGSDEDAEGAGTFDTFSELVLPAGLKDDEDD
ncbi:hypothetical protein LSCM1_03889 [Leishmania martiniquensis]|uniref:Uncharacterized protein n=1 Tax=Leishmania martiniquensis TaxID=1580590 RepID=A0A836KJ29_9TRYP|nr:hypothetical protein LSCM1_03889 [Leishmania martiniquensis]